MLKLVLPRPRLAPAVPLPVWPAPAAERLATPADLPALLNAVLPQAA